MKNIFRIIYTFILGDEANPDMPLKNIPIHLIIRCIINPAAKIFYFFNLNIYFKKVKKILAIIRDLIFGDDKPDNDKNKDIGFVKAIPLMVKVFCYAIAIVLDHMFNWIFDKIIIIFFQSDQKTKKQKQ